MRKFPITIGQISLQDFEVPTSVQFGGQQRLALHRLAGGTRVIEPLGPDDGEIRFHGVFSGAEAEARARALDNLRLLGAVVPLTWQSFQYSVIVKKFRADYCSPWWIRYQVSCVVANQRGAAAIDSAGLPDMIAADFSVATAVAQGTDISLGALPTLVGTTGALTAGTNANAQALAAANATLGALEVQIDQLAQAVLPIALTTEPAALASAFSTQITQSATLAKMVNVWAYVRRITISLQTTEA